MLSGFDTFNVFYFCNYRALLTILGLLEGFTGLMMNMNNRKSVVVIGAGVAGLASIKSCLEEGFQVVCYELTSHVGGLWRFRDEVDEDTTCVFRSVVLNGSKEMSAYSDFPPPKEFPPYPRHFDWQNYLESYCDHFDLRKHIKFNHKVVEVVKAEDYESTGRWKVAVCDIHNGKDAEIVTFDYVMICNGHHVYPVKPKFPGQERFQGRILHSKEYKRAESFREQRVVVIGFGNSALDISSDLCSSTQQVYLSTRRKGWIVPRTIEGGKITDVEISRRSFQLRYQYLPFTYLLAKYESILNSVLNHEFYGVKPKHSLAAQRPIANDLLPMNLMSGSILLKPGIKEFKEEGVIFDGEDEVTEVDSVVFATGFQPLHPFLKGMENADTYMDQMYKLVFPASHKHHSLSIIGMIDPNLSVLVCIEMQARFSLGVFSGRFQLPSKEVMLEEAQKVQDNIRMFTYEGFKQKTLTNGAPYLEDLASMLGAKPDLFKILRTDPILFWRLIFGPQVPYQFRVQGPHAWTEAREAILGAEERTTHVLCQSRYLDDQKKNGKGKVLLISLGILLGGVLLWQAHERKPEFLNELLLKLS